MKHTVLRTAAGLNAAVLISASILSGCGHAPDSMTSAQKAQSDRLSEITTKTGGDWNKLTPDDKTYLINNIAHGDESVARTVLQVNIPHTAPHGRPDFAAMKAKQ